MPLLSSPAETAPILITTGPSDLQLPNCPFRDDSFKQLTDQIYKYFKSELYHNRNAFIWRLQLLHAAFPGGILTKTFAMNSEICSPGQ